MNIDYNELYQWIDEQPITRQKKNLHRDFSDAVPLAEILKEHYPKFVELHNYSPQNAFVQKINNWQTLNRKVLNKLKINLQIDQIHALAKGTPGVIEKLLTDIKSKIELKAAGDQNSAPKVFYLDGITNFEGDVIPIKIKNGSKVMDQKMVPSEMYDKMEKSIAEKDEIITELQNKVTHLEHLLNVKDERIRDLTRQLQSVVNDTQTTNDSSPKSRFFNRIF